MKKFLTVFFAFTLYFNLITEANASIVGGWTMSNPIAKGASTVYTGTKNVIINGADYIKKGTAKITPPATGVAKVLARGVAGYALSVAVEQILGAVDWVLDPENSRIKYWTVDDPKDADYIWWIGDKKWGICYNESNCASVYMTWMRGFENAQNPTATCKKVGTSMDCTGKADGGRTFQNTMSGQAQVPEQGATEKYLPLVTVAQKVIDNAESNSDQNKKAASQVATTAAAADIVAEAEKDDVKARPIAQQLESSAQTKSADEAAAEKANEATGQAKPNTANPEATDLSIEFPVFCGWAPTICEAAQTVISFPQTLTNWWETGKSKAEEWALSISEAWTAAKEWATSEDGLPEKEEIEQPTELPAESKTYNINWSAQCPTAQTVPINFHGVTAEITVADFSYLCSLDWLIKPFVIAFASISAAFIVFGFNRGGDDG